jgi:DNA repair photolyase
MYKEVAVKTALHKITSNYLPYKWDLNIYRGCSHKCHYCFATYSHQYLQEDNFFGNIYIKTNIAEALEKKLASKKWAKDIINIGGVTDSYQKAEEKYQLMPKIWQLLIKYRNPAIISTKSKLILRDIDIINKLSQLVNINIAATIITTDENIRKKTEPGASSINDRFALIKEFKKKTNCSVGIHTMPIIPKLTDSKENLEAIFARAKEANADYLITGILNLYSQTKITFFEFILKNYPELKDYLAELYTSAFVRKEYSNNLYKIISSLRKKYQMPSYSRVFDQGRQFNNEQLNLF